MKKATYSEGFKEQALSKVVSRGDRTVQAVAEDLNISMHTLKNGMKKPLPESTNKIARKPKRPGNWSPEERLIALQESHGLSGDSPECLVPGEWRVCPSTGRVESRFLPPGETGWNVAKTQRNCAP